MAGCAHPTGSAGQATRGAKANRALTLCLDHPGGADQIGYEQATGPLAGLGGYVEIVFQDDFFIDNANLLKAPGYAIVNLNVHYTTEFISYAKRLNPFFEARNVCDKTYVASAQNLANSISATSGLQNSASALANTTSSVFEGAPRNFVGGMRLAF